MQGKPVEVHSNGGQAHHAVADIFPAYDDEEGGVLVVLTPAQRALRTGRSTRSMV